MNENLKVLFGLVGGLALFLYGMNSMSEALQKAAGEKMKKILAALTRNPLLGAFAGALVTAVLQSSSATTVMVIGFVSAGLMTLPQAISVIFGANIGTTMTAQLMAFKISDYIYPILFIGFMLNFVGKKEKIKNVGMVAFSFGMLFEGIEIMGSVMKPLAASPIFLDLMGKVADIPVLGVVLGAVMTLVVQSSSATIAVLQNFASQAGPDGVTSVIGLAGAIPILLGDNIGTTITALLASIGQSRDAKRTAVAHSVFNISGSIVFACVIPYFAKFVQWVSPKGAEVDVIARQIANAHTTFNIACTLIWLPLLPLMVKIVTKLVRGKEQAVLDNSLPRFLDENAIAQPVVAMYQVSQEINRLSEFARTMLHNMKHVIAGKEEEEQSEAYLEHHETVKKLQEHIEDYIAKLFSSGTITEAQAEQTAGLLFISTNIDRMADSCDEIKNTYQIKIKQTDKKLSQDARDDLKDCIAIAEKMFYSVMDAVRNGDEELAAEVVKNKNKMKKAQKGFNKSHLSRIKKKNGDAVLTAEYSEILYSADRIAECCVGIAETVLDHVGFVNLEDEDVAALAMQEVMQNA